MHEPPALAPYPMSSDYTFLARYIRLHPVACALDWRDCRDLAEASAMKLGDGYCYTVGVRGRAYIHAFSEQEFIDRCRELDLEFIDPRLTPESSIFATVLMWIGAITSAAILCAILILTLTAAL